MLLTLQATGLSPRPEVDEIKWTLGVWNDADRILKIMARACLEPHQEDEVFWCADLGMGVEDLERVSPSKDAFFMSVCEEQNIELYSLKRWIERPAH